MKIGKTILKLIFDGVLILLAVIGILLFLLWKDTWDPYNNTIADNLVPTFSRYSLDTTHVFDAQTSLPVRGSSLIDLDNDGIDEIFLGGGAGQADQIFEYKNNSFSQLTDKYIISKADNLNSLAASSVDIDNNGYTDLIVSREDGIYIYYNDGENFRVETPEININDTSNPLGLTFGDINKDGFTDIFLSTYIKKELMNGLTNFSPGYGATSALLLNNGDGSFENITTEAGLDYIHNTFQGVLVDLDNDSWLDLVVAYDTGEPRIYKNNGDTTFTLKQNPWTNTFSYPMGIGVGDINNDGLTDLMFSNIGSSLPKAMVKGDIENTDDLILDWFLLENKGNFVFEDTAKKRQISNYEFSWGAVIADMNNDSREDLIVSENFVDLSFHKLFKLPGRFLLQRKDGIFATTGKSSGVTNKHFGITPLVSDLNNDGALDMIWVNISEPSFAFINNNNVKGNYLQISFPETAKYLGAKAILTLANGTTRVQNYITGEGLVGDQSNTIHFGLADTTSIETLTLKYIDGAQEIINNPIINSKIVIK
ncbi:VCBS repeat-containing protein [Candidatus Gracilibacteria bacterium]|nr:VCBS repeat-containing protein [Candidatus Gracilibacteria bacterium]